MKKFVKYWVQTDYSRKIIIKIVIFITVVLVLVPRAIRLVPRHHLAREVNTFIILKALITWLKHFLGEILVHVRLMALQLVIAHLVQVSIFVVKSFKVLHFVLTPAVIVSRLIFKLPRFISYRSLLLLRGWWEIWTGCWDFSVGDVGLDACDIGRWRNSTLIFVVSHIKQLICVKIGSFLLIVVVFDVILKLDSWLFTIFFVANGRQRSSSLKGRELAWRLL